MALVRAAAAGLRLLRQLADGVGIPEDDPEASWFCVQ
jgi:hypothetical protein